MKRHEPVFVAVVAVLALVAAACSGGGSDPVAADATATAIEAGPTEAATPDPTSEPQAPTVSDDELIAAAVAELDTLIAAGEGPSDTIAYDLLGSRVDDEGVVTLNICAWTGTTVFDQVRDSLYRTRIADDGTIEATHITTPGTVGDCLNTTLIETALDFIDEYESYWTSIVTDPSAFETDPRTDVLLTAGYKTISAELVMAWLDAGIYFEPSLLRSDVRRDASAPTLYRRYQTGDRSVLELVTCREMNPEYGAYSDGVLIDDQRSDATGPHAIDAYQLTINGSEPAGFTAAGGDALAWADCITVDDWAAAAATWRDAETPFHEVDQ